MRKNKYNGTNKPKYDLDSITSLIIIIIIIVSPIIKGICHRLYLRLSSIHDTIVYRCNPTMNFFNSSALFQNLVTCPPVCFLFYLRKAASEPKCYFRMLYPTVGIHVFGLQATSCLNVDIMSTRVQERLLYSLYSFLFYVEMWPSLFCGEENVLFGYFKAF